MTHECVDCQIDPPKTVRPAPFGGPRSKRCATHERAKRVATKKRAKETRIERVYSITPEEYDALYAAQGGRCAICQRSTGKARRLAVDHDHACCNGPVSCGLCVRGLLCKFCNSYLIGRYGIQALLRAARYLLDPPAPKVLAKMRNRTGT